MSDKSSAEWESIGWMDEPPIEKRPQRGRVAHAPSYDLAYHDLYAPGVGSLCKFCGHGSNAVDGAVRSFVDPADPVTKKILAHQAHYDSHYAEAHDASPIATQEIPGKDGKGLTINIFMSKKDEDVDGP